jgi:hypothetical protein
VIEVFYYGIEKWSKLGFEIDAGMPAGCDFEVITRRRH